MQKILLLEDDISLVDGLEYSLKKNGFEIELARTVGEALSYLQEINRFDLLLLDVTLPDGTGFEVCENVRKQGSHVPIIFLTASDEEVNIIRGLDSGGDDYITKPFRLGELCSRIRALLRRAGVSGLQDADKNANAGANEKTDGNANKNVDGRANEKTDGNTDKNVNGKADEEANIIECGDITIDLLGSRVSLNGRALDLTSAEYRLICLLVQNAGRILTRDTILNKLWDDAGSFVGDNTLSVYVRRLREKVEADPSRPGHLITVRGFGYQWKEVRP